MNKRTFFVFFLALILLNACAKGKKKLSGWQFYNALYRQDVEIVKLHLENGYDPNKCRGEAGWVDSNPLRILAEGIYTYKDNPAFTKTEMMAIAEQSKNESRPDIEILSLLVEKGADINKLPYIWDRVVHFNNKSFSRMKETRENRKINLSDEDIEWHEMCWVENVNVLLEAMLKAGMNPNMKGHPYPFGKTKDLLFFTDKKAFKYFNSEEATTPLYEAIKKGIKWESQVDLLLQYGAILDESCLKAAEESGDAAMVEKIKFLLEDIRK